MLLAKLIFHHLCLGFGLGFFEIPALRAYAYPVAVNVEGCLPNAAPRPLIELDITVVHEDSLWAENRHTKHSVKPSVFCPLFLSASTPKCATGVLRAFQNERKLSR